jgi:hypothetical protein
LAHLLKKLEELKGLNPKTIEPNPVFIVVNGGVEPWKKPMIG